MRQERFAQLRLQGARERLKFPYEDGAKEREKHKSALELRLDVVKETFWRFLLEREVDDWCLLISGVFSFLCSLQATVEFLVGSESHALRQAAQKMSSDVRGKRLQALRTHRSKWRQYSKGYRLSQSRVNESLLRESMASRTS